MPAGRSALPDRARSPYRKNRSSRRSRFIPCCSRSAGAMSWPRRRQRNPDHPRRRVHVAPGGHRGRAVSHRVCHDRMAHDVWSPTLDLVRYFRRRSETSWSQSRAAFVQRQMAFRQRLRSLRVTFSPPRWRKPTGAARMALAAAERITPSSTLERLGLRGTGSRDIAVEDNSVPAHRAINGPKV